MLMNRNSLLAKLKKIKLLILDVDGVLTDGTIYFTHTGKEILSFHVHDGLGIERLQKMEIKVAIISGRDTSAVKHRLTQLKIEHQFLGQRNKVSRYLNLIDQLRLSADQVAYVGDDLPDIDIMKQVGVPIAVANAFDIVKKTAIFCTKKKGGHGAVREVCDLIIEANV